MLDNLLLVIAALLLVLLNGFFVAAEFGLPLWDMENLPADQQFGDADFGDLNHLNERGSTRLTSMVAELFTKWVAEKGQ